MRKYKLVFALLLVFTIGCKKDNLQTIKEEEEIVTPENWLATQNVRINKVEFVSTDPYYNDSLITIHYVYGTNGILKSIQSNINIETNGITETFKISESTESIFIENFSESCRRYNLFGLVLAENNIKILNNKVDEIRGKVNTCTFGFIGPTKGERTSKFSYDKNGLLNSIKSYFGLDSQGPVLIKETNSIVYDSSGNVKSLKMLAPSLNETTTLDEDYSMSFDYYKTTEVPNGLIRIVNQSILEMNSLGHEDLSSLIFYSMKGDGLERRYTDWVCSFGLSKIQMIPAQNIDLISSKRITGSRLVYNDTTEVPISVNVDTTYNFPYIHDSAAKTLEIAGLKIWYELIK
ncbi:MAG: hypothetical protein M9958_03590 [Chitinophagales bacterium]|nr:hypothetical protein [Chitinophagales bacterium]